MENVSGLGSVFRNRRVLSWFGENGRIQDQGGRNPALWEFLMGFPIGWTELEPSATPLCQPSQNSSDEPSSKRRKR